MVEGGGGHALISKIMGINTAGAMSVLLTNGEERVDGISDAGPSYSDPLYRKTGIPREIYNYILH